MGTRRDLEAWGGSAHMLQSRRRTRARTRRRVAFMHHATERARPLQHQGLQAPSTFGKRKAMTELVTSHGLTSTPTSVPPTTPSPPLPTVVTAAIQELTPTLSSSPQLKAGDGADTVAATLVLPVSTDPTPIKH